MSCLRTRWPNEGAEDWSTDLKLQDDYCSHWQRIRKKRSWTVTKNNMKEANIGDNPSRNKRDVDKWLPRLHPQPLLFQDDLRILLMSRWTSILLSVFLPSFLISSKSKTSCWVRYYMHRHFSIYITEATVKHKGWWVCFLKSPLLL